MNLTEKIQKLKSLSEGDSVVINAVVYTRIDDQDEWKVSPFGLVGDYDSACYWINSEELVHELLETQDLTKPVVFSQDTPQMQAAAILQGIEGHLINWHDGIAPSERSLENARMLVEHLKALVVWLPEEWNSILDSPDMFDVVSGRHYPKDNG